MVFSNNLLLGAGGQSTDSSFNTTLIGNSVWLDGSADFLNKTPSAGTTTRWIVSFWVKRNTVNTGAAQTIFSAGTATGNLTWIRFDASDNLDFAVYQGSVTARKTSSAKYRDMGWYHICVSFDSGSGITASDRIKLFVNGVEVSELSASTATPSGETTAFNANLLHEIGRYSFNGGEDSNVYLTQFTMLENKSFQNGDLSITDLLDSFTFGTNGSQFTPKADADIASLASSAGGRSFCLDFANSSDLGNDISSNNNDFTPNSMAAANQTTSSPSSAFATWNPLRVNTQTQTFAEGNLRFSSSQTSTNPAATGNYGVSSGKFYWEVFVVAQGNTSNMLGICDVAAGLEDDTTALYASALMYAYEFDGEKRNNNSSSSYGDAIATNDIVGIALDMDNGGVYFSKNGTFQASGDPTSGASLTNAAFTGLKTAGSGIFQPYYLAYSNGDGVANFGQSPTFNGQTTAGGNSDTNSRGNFKYSVPSGYSALTSANLTAPEKQGVDYFKPVLYTGNGTAIGSGGKAVTGVGFQPDWTWIKNRDATDSHGLYDIVRGVTKQIESDNTSVQTTEAEGLTTFGSDGFTVGNLDQVNTNTEDFVSWNWLGNNATESISADGANPTLASTNTASDNGSFGICTYTGDTTAGSTVKHSLDGIPEMIFFKRYGSTTANWMVYHKDTGTGNSDYLMLDTTGVKGGAGAVNWLNATTPTSTLVTLGSDSNVNASDTYIMYLFRSIAGVCKVGSYIGNLNDNGPYVSTGFKPAYVMIKSTTTARDWVVFDTSRDPINLSDHRLDPSNTGAEFNAALDLDILSDGFKFRSDDIDGNGDGVKYIYLAMADIGGNGTLPPVYGR